MLPCTSWISQDTRPGLNKIIVDSDFRRLYTWKKSIPLLIAWKVGACRGPNQSGFIEAADNMSAVYLSELDLALISIESKCSSTNERIGSER